ncbi:MAG: PorV/PorQ family protein [Candidatus Zixiibacteriota bacterium]|jgi:opacity protein-like surface antigen
MIRNSLIVAVLLAVLATGALAADGDGGYAGAFLQVPIGARPTALGGAYVAVSNDGAGVLYNPAGLTAVKQLLFASSYRAMQLDRKLGYVNFLIPVEGDATLGFSYLYAGSGSVTARDADGYALDHNFDFNNHDFSVIFAKQFEKYLSLGGRLHFYYARFPEVDATSVGFDIGGMLHVDELINRETREFMPVRDIQVGLVVKHISVKYPWNSQEYNIRYTTDDLGYVQDDKVPIEVALGASARFLQRKLMLTTDLSKNDKQATEFHGGAEYFISPEFALRAGYGDKRLTAGTGYVFKFGKRLFAVDYAFSTDKADEGSEHIFSFDLLF